MIKLSCFLSLMAISLNILSQTISKNIIVDQFGYLPNSTKIAVIKNPKVGFDNAATFSPGQNYAIIDANSGKEVFTGKPAAWKSGATDASSGDMAWHFDFSSVTTVGDYLVLDVDNQKASYRFRISPAITTNTPTGQPITWLR